MTGSPGVFVPRDATNRHDNAAISMLPRLARRPLPRIRDETRSRDPESLHAVYAEDRGRFVRLDRTRRRVVSCFFYLNSMQTCLADVDKVFCEEIRQW